ncbi:hypothetical protein AB205_0161650, partial [Aquarana catesbeiana]
EMNALRPSPLKPGMRRNSAVTCYPAVESGPQLSLYYRPDRAREAESRGGHCKDGMSQSGRNSMSSLPTHPSKLGTACHLDALLMPTGRFGGSAHNITQSNRSNMLSLRAMSLSDGGNANKILSVPTKPGLRSPPSCEKLARAESSENADEGHRGGISRSRQSSQRGQRPQHMLSIQVTEREPMEGKMRGYEKEKKITISPSMDETQWEVCQKSGEIASLRQQLRETQEEASLRASEILSLKAQLRETKGRGEALEQRAREAEERLRVVEAERDERDDTVVTEVELESLRTELEAERQNNEQMTDVFQRERKTWRDEKEKVIRYQRQLQQNYLHMCQRCQALEQRLRALSGEDLDDGPIMTLPDMELSFQDILATEI